MRTIMELAIVVSVLAFVAAPSFLIGLAEWLLSACLIGIYCNRYCKDVGSEDEL